MNYSSTHSSNGATHLLLLAAESTAYKSKVCESLDYDLFESQVRLRYQKKTSQLPHHVSTIDEAKRWMLTTLVATSTALIAVFITWCTRTLLELKYDTAQHFLSPSSEQNNESFNHFLAWCILTTINLTFVGIASLVVVYIAPIASGSGIPEIKCLLNGIKIPHVVRVKTLFAKVAGVIFSVSGGLPIGKEGPMIHSGAIVGAGLSQGKSTTCGYDTGFSKLSMFRNDREKSDFITCGTAAGVAAAFGAPIGGVLFCLEEGTSWWNPSLTWRTFFSAMVATLFVDLFLSQVNQTVDFGYFSQPGMLSFGSFIESDLISPYNMIELLPFSLIGILGGVFGAGFNALNTKITKLRLKLKRNGKKKWLRVIICMFISFIITSISFLTPIFGPNDCIDLDVCRNTTIIGNRTIIPSLGSFANSFDWDLNTMQFNCPKHQFSPLATLSYGSNEMAIKYLFHSSNTIHSCGPSTNALLWYGICYTLLACTVYGMPVPSGLFVPGILSGAIYGRLAGILFISSNILTRHAAIGTYALVGSAAMLGGISRLCISLTVILIECTGDIQLTVPLMVAVLSARWSANMINDGLYDIHVELNEFPYLPYKPPRETSTLRVSSIMTRDPLVLRPVERVETIIQYLAGTRHHAFPVVTYREKENRSSLLSSSKRQKSISMHGSYGSGNKDSNGSGLGSGSILKDSGTRVARRLNGLMLRKHLTMLLSKCYKKNVFIPSNYFRESRNGWTVTRVPDAELEREREKIMAEKEVEEVNVGGEEKSTSLSTTTTKKNFPDVYRTMSAFEGTGLNRPLIVDFRDNVLSWEMLEGLYPRYLPYDKNLTEEELNCWVDLRPYMNEAPPMISSHSVVTQAYQMFRHLGLRHLCVVDDDKDCVGIVTRHELLLKKIKKISKDDEEGGIHATWTSSLRHRLHRNMTAT